MGSVNDAVLIGNVGRDPDCRRSNNDTLVCKISVATTYKSKKGEETTWHNVVLFGQKAEFAERYVRKGSQVYIRGRMTNRTYEHEGQQKRVHEIVCNDIQTLDRKPVQEDYREQWASRKAEKENADVPF